MSRTKRLVLILGVLAGISGLVLYQRTQRGWAISEAENQDTRCRYVGEPYACTRGGWLYESGDEGTEKDRARAHALYTRGCAMREGFSCGGASRTHPKESRTVRSLVEEERFLAIGCRLKDAWCCLSFGDRSKHMLADGRRDLPGAEALYRTACDAGEKEACVALATLVLNQPLSTYTDAYDAVARLGKACEESVPFACRYYASAQMCGEGQDPKPEAAARKLLAMCVAGDTHACARTRSAFIAGVLELSTLPRGDAGLELRTSLARAYVHYDLAEAERVVEELKSEAPEVAQLYVAGIAIERGSWAEAESALAELLAPDGGTVAEAEVMRAALNAARSNHPVTDAMVQRWQALGEPDFRTSPYLADYESPDAYACSPAMKPPMLAWKDIRHYEMLAYTPRPRTPVDERYETLVLSVSNSDPVVDRLIALQTLRETTVALYGSPKLKAHHDALTRSLAADMPENGFATLLKLNTTLYVDAPALGDAEVDELEHALSTRIDLPRELVWSALEEVVNDLPEEHLHRADVLGTVVSGIVGISSIAGDLGQRCANTAALASEPERKRIAKLVLKLAHVSAGTGYLADLFYAARLANISWRLNGEDSTRLEAEGFLSRAMRVYADDGPAARFGRWPVRSLSREFNLASRRNELAFMEAMATMDAGL